MNTAENKELIRLLADCLSECNHCATSCLEEENVEELTNCIKLDLDCAQICGTAIAFLSRNSAHAEHILQECAEICDQCADECEKHSHMEHCKACAEICRRCAEACGVLV
jgi:hypothetical protein